ncbi:hypothetical protein D3C78_1710690 [compost metagenome]
MDERNRLHHVFQQALAQPEARNALIAQGYEIKLTPPDATAAFMRSELQRMAEVVKNARVKVD